MLPLQHTGLGELEVSAATLKRSLVSLKDQRGAPIQLDRFHGRCCV